MGLKTRKRALKDVATTNGPQGGAINATCTVACESVAVPAGRATVGPMVRSCVFGCAVGLLFVLVSTGGCNALKPSVNLGQLAGSAVRPDQHMAIADDYRRRAAEARTQMNHHFALAAQYRGTTGARKQDSSTAGEMAEHCAILASGYESIAEEYEALANNHESLAVGGHGSSPPYEKRGDRGL